jgi:DHA3 family macrolide efflux protein-like MFS transporter
MVPEEKLLRVNGINSSVQSMIMLVSPVLSGVLLSFASIEAIFFIDVVTAAIAIGTLAIFLRIPAHAKAMAPQTTGYFQDMKMGFRYIREHRYLASFFIYLGIFVFLVTPAAFLTPLQTTRTFGPEVWRLTALEILFSGGMMVGGALLATWGGFRNRMRTMVASNLIMAGCTIALGLAPPFWLYLAIMGIFGISMPIYNTPGTVMIQEHVEGDYMGRVFSILTMLMTSAMPLGMLIFGPLADAVRIEWILIASGVVMLLHGLRALGSRRLMEAGEPVTPAGAVVSPEDAHETEAAGT